MRICTITNGNGGAPRDPRLLEGVLSKVPVFRSIGQHQIADLAGRAKAIHFRRGETICAQGRALPGFYAIAFGQVKLAFRGEGEERVARIAGPVETFGLAAALLGRPTPYEVAALEDCLLIMVPSAAILQMVENDPRFARAVIVELAERTMTLLAEVESASLHGGVQRLAAYLDALAGNGTNGGCTVRLPTTKTVVAARLGIKKETLSRLLRGLAQKGMIVVDQREIEILDRQRLSALASESL
jgi:CRP/FNR family transcriptional regulator, dissimilatory nitrate respiration regulator